MPDHPFRPDPWGRDACDAMLADPDGRSRTCGLRKVEHEAEAIDAGGTPGCAGGVSGAAAPQSLCEVCGRERHPEDIDFWEAARRKDMCGRRPDGLVDSRDCYRLGYEREKAAREAAEKDRDAWKRAAEIRGALLEGDDKPFREEIAAAEKDRAAAESALAEERRRRDAERDLLKQARYWLAAAVVPAKAVREPLIARIDAALATRDAPSGAPRGSHET